MKKKAKADAEAATKANSATMKASSVASKRLQLLKDMKSQLGTLKDELAEESHSRSSAEGQLVEEAKLRGKLERMITIRKQIKREKPVGRKGGAASWPVHVVLLICELLVNGTPPSAVPPNIQTMSATFNGCESKELPTVDFVRKCRTVVENLNYMFAGHRLASATSWHQLFTDGTSRRQIAFQNLVIGLMEGDEFDSVIASLCIFSENETAAKQVEGINSKVCYT